MKLSTISSLAEMDVIIGRNPVLEAIKSGRTIDRLFVKEGKAEGSLIPIIKKAKELKIPVIYTKRARLDEMCEGENHQGVIAAVSDYSYAAVEDIFALAKERGEDVFVVICDKLTDPHNLGAVIRTANCAGAHGVIIPERSSAGLNAAAVKAAAGAVEYTPVARVKNLSRTIDMLKERGLWIACADMGGELMYKADLTGALGIVVGSEGDGVSRLVREKCDFTVSVPMRGEINSLNASVAAGVLMYEAYRQRNYGKE